MPRAAAVPAGAFHHPPALVVTGLVVALLTLPVAAQRVDDTPHRRSLGEGISIQQPPRWQPSRMVYANATELVIYPPLAEAKPGVHAPQRPPPAPLARILITTEARRSHAEALLRLREIAEQRPEAPTFRVIGGWPALEQAYRERLAARGERREAAEPPATARAITIIAADNRLLRFDAALLTGTGDPALLREARDMARSTEFAHRGDAEVVSREVQELGRWWEIHQPPIARHSRSSAAPGRAFRNAGNKATGAPVLTQGGNGEVEIAVSGTGTEVVVASNSGLSSSNDSGTTFHAGNVGIFPLSDPSLAVGASGNFYLSVIASPDGTPAQGGVTGCANAVSSSPTGAQFAFAGHSTVCALSPGTCFPDQEHIGADATNVAGTGGDQLYVVWRNFVPATPVMTCGGIAIGVITATIVCSQDSGKTWSNPAVVTGAADFPRVAVGSDGAVYVVSILDPSPARASVILDKFNSCANGLQLQPGYPTTVASPFTVTCPVPGLDRCNNGNTLSSPTVAVDPANAGHVFVTYAEKENIEDPTALGERISVAEATNDQWSAAKTSQVSVGTARRFMPWSCALNGNLYVSWYDRRAANAGVTNDLTDFYLGRVVNNPTTVAPETDLSNNPDAECASGWPGGVRSPQDSQNCTLPNPPAGLCTQACAITPQPGVICPASSNAPCDFAAAPPTGCPVNEACSTGSGAPKYGDYNGIACASDRVYTAWASATPPGNIAAAPPGINVFTSVLRVTPCPAGEVMSPDKTTCVTPSPLCWNGQPPGPDGSCPAVPPAPTVHCSECKDCSPDCEVQNEIWCPINEQAGICQKMLALCKKTCKEQVKECKATCIE